MVLSSTLSGSPKKRALRFVLLIGVVSLFADFTYEGSRSITGQFLAQLGTSATIVAVVAGLGELLGYGLRLVSGRLSEKTQKFWPITLFGYFIQMLSVPALYSSNELVGGFVNALRTLRQVGERHHADFKSLGFTQLFAMLATELNEEYLAEVERHVVELRFNKGVLISAELGDSRRGR